MPRSGGVYSLPAGSIVANGTTADASQHNTPLNDIAADLNAARPVSAGGTGSTTVSGAQTALSIQPANANLTSIAGLTFAENKGLYTTAANTAALFDLTAAGLALLDDADAPAQLVTLGLTASAEELNLLDGVTALSGEDNILVTGTAGTAGQLAQWNADGDIVGVNASFPAGYVSAGQTITSSGLVTLTHGLGSVPKQVAFYLECATDDAGYTASDIVPINPALNTNFSGSGGMAVVLSATQIRVRFGNNANVFIHSRFDTGAATILDNAKWQLIVRAWV